MRQLSHDFDLCVLGGGLSGLCTAISAARRGARVGLVQDRPVLGGNASSEIRMWVCGAHGLNNRETGILEEIHLENLHRNPEANWSIWDSILYEKARFQENLTLFLNTTCTGLEMSGSSISALSCWGLTNETRHHIKARLFADCSGDAILAPWSGADFRVGREAQSEFNEDIQPDCSDSCTMGLSCLFSVRETHGPKKYTPPSWANIYESDQELSYRNHNIIDNPTNFWWIELGGQGDSIHEAEELRDELLKIAFGVWDHIKNRGDHGADNWVMDWMGFLPGKRESRRYLGDHVLTQNDIRAEGRFEDTVAYGGWSMDDHHPAGIYHPGQPTVFHSAPSPYGIPYRSLYSRNVTNLFCAGRNISATHAAMSSTRVMATCSLMGQAVGNAAAIAAEGNMSPRGVYETELDRLQEAIMEDDCWLPWKSRKVPQLSRESQLTSSLGQPEVLRNGIDRPFAGQDNCWQGKLNSSLTYSFDSPCNLSSARIVFDSDLNRERLCMRVNYPLDCPPQGTPSSLVRSFKLEVEDSGSWREIYSCQQNWQRLLRLDLKGVKANALRLTPLETWGAPAARIFGFEVS